VVIVAIEPRPRPSDLPPLVHYTEIIRSVAQIEGDA